MDHYAPAASARSRSTPHHRDWARMMLAAGAAFVATLFGLILLAWLVLFVTKGRFLTEDLGLKLEGAGVVSMAEA